MVLLFVLCSDSVRPCRTVPWHLVVARIVGGTGIGIASMLSPMYIAEIAPPRLRGGLISTYQLAITIGIVVAYFSNYAFAFLVPATTPTGMRYSLALDLRRRKYGGECCWPALSLPRFSSLLLFFIPESPRWGGEEGRSDAAMKICSALNGLAYATQEMQEIEENACAKNFFHRPVWYHRMRWRC